MDRYSKILQTMLGYAKSDYSVKAITAIGSYTRTDSAADEYSDLDLIIATSAPEKWISGEIPELFGNVNISFAEPTLGGGIERRCIYDEDKDVDLIVFTPEQFHSAIIGGAAGWVMNRGYKVLYDIGGFGELLKYHIVHGHSAPVLNEQQFTDLVNDFYFHNIWAAKKLKRGELWSAKMNVDAYLKQRLLMIAQLYRSRCGEDVWHDGRFFDKWAGQDITEELKGCFARYDSDEVMKALIATHDLFDRLSSAVTKAEGFAYPDKARECAKKYLGI